jgi:hypothetical protein
MFANADIVLHLPGDGFSFHIAGLWQDLLAKW